MKRAGVGLVLVACGGAAAVFGCDDPVVMSTADTRPRPRAAADASASVGLEEVEAPRPPIDESEFAEGDRSRDPFRSYARSFVEDAKPKESQRHVVLEEYALDELKLIGIVTRVNPAKAMLLDPTGKGHVIQRGQFVGRADLVQTGGRTGTTYEINWRVDRVRDGDVVFVRADPQNPDVPTITRVIPLRPEGALVDNSTGTGR